MAAITVEDTALPNQQNRTVPGILTLPVYSLPNGVQSPSHSKLSVDLHNVRTDVDQSKLSLEHVNGVSNKSADTIIPDVSYDNEDSEMAGTQMEGKENLIDPQDCLCGRIDKEEIFNVCSNGNDPRDIPNGFSEDFGSEHENIGENLKETNSEHSCNFMDTDSKPRDQSINSLMSVEHEPVSRNSPQAGSAYMDSTDKSLCHEPHFQNCHQSASNHEPHSKNSNATTFHEPHPENSVTDSDLEPHSQDQRTDVLGHEPNSQDQAIVISDHDPNSQDHRSHSQKLTGTPSECRTVSRKLTDTSLKHRTETRDITTEYQVIVSYNADDSGSHEDKDREISVEIIKDAEKDFSFRTLSKRQLAIVFSFCMVGFANYLCLSLIAPFFPKEAREKNVSNLVSGWIFAAFPLTQFIFAPAFGKLLPFVGLRFLYLSGTFISGGCTILFGFMTYVDVTNGTEVFIIMCFVLRVAMALGCCANQTASFTLCAQEFKETVGTIFGLGEVFVGLGFMCGPAIGGVLYGMGGFLIPFAVIGGIIILTTILNYWIVPSDQFVPHMPSSGVSLFVMVKSYKTVINCITITVAAIIWSILDPTLEPHLEEFELSSELIGLLFLLMAAVYAIASPIWGRLSDKMKDSRVILIIGCILSTVGMLLVGPSTLLGYEEGYKVPLSELWLNIISLVIIGIGDSAAIIPTFDLLFKIAEERGFENNIETYSILAGMWASMYALGDFLGPAIGGFLLDEIGFQSMTTYIALLTTVMAVVLVVTILFDKSSCCKRGATEKQSEEQAPLLGKEDTDKSYLYTSGSNLLDSYPPQTMATHSV